MTSETEKPIGIVSHGQLAMMTAEAAKKMRIPTIVLGPSGTEPSPASYVTQVYEGDHNNPDHVYNFSKMTRSLVLDTDHVSNLGLLKAQNRGVAVFPSAGVNEVIQNRTRQKEMMDEAGIKTAPWASVYTYEDIRYAFFELGGNVIVKKSEGGFDARGNRNASTPEELDSIWRDFEGNEMIVEQKLNFDTEVAIIAAKDIYGGEAYYPPVKSYNDRGMLEYTVYDPNLNPDIVDQTMDMAKKVLGIVGQGSHGIETLIVNGKSYLIEVASRPHNTGHWTIEGTDVSQFENLVRIAAGLPVRKPRLTTNKTIVMHNLNGGVQLDKFTEEHRQIIEDMGGVLHDYHKSPRDRRKRGHIYVEGNSEMEAVTLAKDMISTIGFRN